MSSRITFLIGLAMAVAAPGAALAHTGATPTGGLIAGFSHPLLGLDHLLAMVAVGLWAFALGAAALWLVPLAFVGAMVLGGGLALSGLGLPAVELAIVGSVIVLGAVVALRVRVPVALGMAVVAGFALFHGHAHGAEMPASASGLLYGAGFAAATALLHLAGIGLGLGFERLAGAWLHRLGGATICGAGVALLALG